MKASFQPSQLLNLTGTIQLALVAVTFGLAPFADAALINWGPATNISGDADVLTDGPMVGAYSLGGFGGAPNVTVNTVTFEGISIGMVNSITFDNFTLSALDPAGTMAGAAGVWGSANPPFSTLSPQYQALLGTGVEPLSGNPFGLKLTMHNLIVGQQYTFQWWSNSSAGTPVFQTITTATGDQPGNSVSLDLNPAMVQGGLGQYAIGTFYANSTEQEITFQGNRSGFMVLNAFQLRGVPEPGTALASCVALLTGLLMRTGRSARRMQFKGIGAR